MTNLDIALLTAGRVDLFEKCVEAVLENMPSTAKIQVHNNGHPSKEYEEIYKKLPQGSKIIRSNRMSSFADGANKVIRAGNSPLILFITDDVFINATTIPSLLSRMEDQSIGQCGYKFLFPNDTNGDKLRPAGKVQHIGLASSIRGDIIHPLIGWSPDNPKCCVPREVLAVTGASFMVRRNVFTRVNGFSLDYQMGYYEDVDLSFKIRSAGMRVFVETDATAIHMVGQTFKDQPVQAPFQRNQMLFQTKWAGAVPYSEWEMW